MGKIVEYTAALAALALLLTACYEKQEGCLDIRAVNFDVAADLPCSDCCTYPRLSLKPEHRLVFPDSVLPFRYDSLYATPSHPDVGFRVHRLRYYLSGIRLLGAGQAGRVVDSITLYLPQGGGDTLAVRAAADFVLADRDFLQAVQLGTWEGQGQFDRLEFIIGIDFNLRQADPDRMPPGHPLSAPADGVNWEEGTGYISNFLAYTLASQPEDTIRVPVSVAAPVSVSIDPPLDIPPGYNLRLNLFFNYLAWWDGLDLSTATPAQVEQHYLNHAADALYAVEVVFQ